MRPILRSVVAYRCDALLLALLLVLPALLATFTACAADLRNFRARGTSIDIAVPVEWIPVDAGNEPDRIQLAFQVPNPASREPGQGANVGVVIFLGAALPAFRQTRSEASLDPTRYPGYVELEHRASDSEEAIRYRIAKGGQTTLINEHFLWNGQLGIVVVASAPELAGSSAAWQQGYAEGVQTLLNSLRRAIAPAS